MTINGPRRFAPMLARRRRALRAAATLAPSSLRPTLRRVALKHGIVDPPAFSYPYRELLNSTETYYPNYLWGTLCAAGVAQTLGLERISVIEFGVAGGNGLLALEACARQAEGLSGVAIDTFGFDSGVGLPKPVDYRDLPQLWDQGFFAMDSELLRQRLSSAQLRLGPVEQTAREFLAADPAPIGFVSFDLDMYSSTVDAFAVFGDRLDVVMPRVVCYFDDIVGFSHGDFTGERLAISEFNDNHEMRKISKIYGLPYILDIRQCWTEQMFMAHFFEHRRYNDFDGSNAVRDLPLGGG